MEEGSNGRLEVDLQNRLGIFHLASGRLEDGLVRRRNTRTETNTWEGKKHIIAVSLGSLPSSVVKAPLSTLFFSSFFLQPRAQRVAAVIFCRCAFALHCRRFYCRAVALCSRTPAIPPPLTPRAMASLFGRTVSQPRCTPWLFIVTIVLSCLGEFSIHHSRKIIGRLGV